MTVSCRRAAVAVVLLALTACGGSSAPSGPAPECVVAADCPGLDTACRQRACSAGTCGHVDAAAGTVLATQVPGDCKEDRCDGAGGVVAVALDADVPASDGSGCTTEACSAGVPVHPPLDADTACSQGGGSFCDGAGSCVACNAPAQCPGSDTECQARTCVAHACGVANALAGTVVSGQVAGDCQESRCDGSGGVVAAALDADVPADDGSACTAEACSGGVPVHPPRAVDTACSQAGGSYCDGAGSCVACNAPAQCPGSDTECQARTCVAGACGTFEQPPGTTVSAQVAGDCTSQVCDGLGAVTSVAQDADLPVDGNQCTDDRCTAGVASNPPIAQDVACSQNGGAWCDGAGACVACNAATQCGTSTDCRTFSCVAHACGVAFTPAGTPTSSQTSGDCKRNECDGSGNVAVTALAADVPVDGDQCTADMCTGSAPSNPPSPAGTACTQGGGTVCNGTGRCVQCLTAAGCPGSDTECQTRTCSSGACGLSYAPVGTPVASQIAGDCRTNVCDGAGAVIAATDNTDLPQDGLQCTADVCVAGTPSNPAVPAGTACNQSGGSQCDGAGACVQCLAAADCPGSDTECQTRTCGSGLCGVQNAASGTPVSGQTAGDCKVRTCDGAGAVVAVADNTDLPVDGNQCTADACSNGNPSNFALPLGTPCNQGGGTTCDGVGRCVAAPEVASTTPADGTTASPPVSVAVTFTTSMSALSLTAQPAAGPCTGSIQLSADGFASCAGFGASAPAMSGGDVTATLTPAPALLVNRAYQLRVTTAATSAAGIPLPATYTSPGGFGTAIATCTGLSGVVISQVYGSGGNTGATYRNDFIELYNRGTVAVDLSGWAIQYQAAASTGTWIVTAIPAGKVIPPGGYFLIQAAAGLGGSVALPTPDATTPTALGSAGGKLALTSGTTALVGPCPGGASLVDFVAWGPGIANCSEGSATGATAVPIGAPTTGAARAAFGCTDTNVNVADFAVATAAPRNSATAPFACACRTANEGGATEAAYCTMPFPPAMTVAAGSPTPFVFGQIYHPGVTEGPGPAASVVAQVGYGPASVNPQVEPGWTWLTAAYNLQIGNNDEYQATFTAPATGSYRYTYRFSIDAGDTWTYCDRDGAGRNIGLDFDPAQYGVLTVP